MRSPSRFICSGWLRSFDGRPQPGVCACQVQEAHRLVQGECVSTTTARCIVQPFGEGVMEKCLRQAVYALVVFALVASVALRAEAGVAGTSRFPISLNTAPDWQGHHFGARRAFNVFKLRAGLNGRLVYVGIVPSSSARTSAQAGLQAYEFLFQYNRSKLPKTPCYFVVVIYGPDSDAGEPVFGYVFLEKSSNVWASRPVSDTDVSSLERLIGGQTIGSP